MGKTGVVRRNLVDNLCCRNCYYLSWVVKILTAYVLGESMTSTIWEHAAYFLTVARCKSLRKAAEELNTTHATVNRHLLALEKSIGARLFRRTSSGVELTNAGKTLLPAAEQAEVLLGAARRRLEGIDKKESGVVRFSITGTMAYEIIAPIFTRFFEAYPEIDLEIRVSDRNEDIYKLETDVSLRYAFEITEDDVVAKKLFPLRLGVFASKTYLERHLPNAGPGGEGLHWIGWGDVDRRPAWVKQTLFPNAEARHATTDHVMQLSLARNNFGMINTSVYFASLYPELTLVPGTETWLDRTLWILMHSDFRTTTRVRCFCGLSRTSVAKHED